MRILGDAAKISGAANQALLEKNLKPERIEELESLRDFPLSRHLVIVDTVTSLMLTTITDAKIGSDPTKALATDTMRNRYLDDPRYLSVYNWGTQMINRRMKNLRSRGARLIVTAHEDEQVDLATQMKKRAPQANKALYEALMGASSDVFRLETNTEDIYGSEGQILIPKNVRILQMKPTSELVAKYHVDRQYSNTIPGKIIDPTMPKVFEALHKKPSFLVLYGPPGSGKTTLALSEVEATRPAQGTAVQAEMPQPTNNNNDEKKVA